MAIINRFFKILGTMLGAKANKKRSQEMSDILKDAAIIKRLAKTPSQQTILNELYNVIDNIALELSSISTKDDRQNALLNRLDKMLQTIDNYKDKDSSLSSIISTIVSIKLIYLERHSDSLYSDEILDWLNKYKSFIPSEDYIKQVQRIRKKTLSKNINTVVPNEGLQWFKQNVDIENMNLVEVNVFFDWYNKNGQTISEPLCSQAQEIVQLGKQKILEQIRQETTKEVSDLVLEHAELGKLLSEGKISLVGTGGNGIVLESEEANTVIKIFHSGDIEKHILSEVKNHADFLDAIAEGKRNKKVSDWVHVPNIVQIPNLTATEFRGQAYIMDRVDGITLKRGLYLKLDEYRSKLEPFMEQEILALSEVEFEKLVKKREGEMATYYNIYPEEGELLPEVFFKAFENDTEKKIGLQQALKYLKDEHQLVHDDLHWKNILIDDQGEIYLIDFGR